MFKLASLAVATLPAMVTGAAQAEPYTLYFEGVVDDAASYRAGGKPPGNPKFSGYVTWDIDRSEHFWNHGFFAEPAVYREPPPGLTRHRHHWAAHRSQSGCPEFKESVAGEWACEVGHRGYDPPLVLDYRFSWDGGDVRPVPRERPTGRPGGLLDESTVHQERNREQSVVGSTHLSKPRDSEHWTISRIQQAKYDGGRLAYFERHEFTLKLSSSDHKMFFSDVTDFTTPMTPALKSDPPSARVTIDSHSSLNDCRYLCAEVGGDGDSFRIHGHLTRAILVAGPEAVPEGGVDFMSMLLLFSGWPWGR